MIFRRTIIAALFVGFLAGLVLSITQTISVNPIILQAETFEVVETHTHSLPTEFEEVWAPEDGTEQSVYTILPMPPQESVMLQFCWPQCHSYNFRV